MGILCDKYRKQVLKFKAVRGVFLGVSIAGGFVLGIGWWNSFKGLLCSLSLLKQLFLHVALTFTVGTGKPYSRQAKEHINL